MSDTRTDTSSPEMTALIEDLRLGCRYFINGYCATLNPNQKQHWCAPCRGADALTAAVARHQTLQQERDAQFAHNSSLLERIKDLDEDNECSTGQLARIQGILDGTGSDGHIKGNIEQLAKDLTRERQQLREALERIAHGWCGDVSVIAKAALVSSSPGQEKTSDG
jgi:hypothetical protein